MTQRCPELPQVFPQIRLSHAGTSRYLNTEQRPFTSFIWIFHSPPAFRVALGLPMHRVVGKLAPVSMGALVSEGYYQNTLPRTELPYKCFTPLSTVTYLEW